MIDAPDFVLTLADQIESLDKYRKTQLELLLSDRSSACETPHRLLNSYILRSGFCRPSSISLVESNCCDKIFIDSVSEKFELLQLAPVMPLGTNSVITSLSQNGILSTQKAFEVLADPTTALALEAAFRLRQGLSAIDLATIDRSLRMQKFDNPHFLQHFAACALVSVKITKFEYLFLCEKFVEHISCYLRFIDLMNSNGYSFKNISVKLAGMYIVETLFSNIDESGKEEFIRHSIDDSYNLLEANKLNYPNEIDCLEDFPVLSKDPKIQQTVYSTAEFIFFRIIAPLKKKFPDVHFTYDLSRKAGRGYYKTYCFHIDAVNDWGEPYTLVDGGDSDWCSKLLNNRKARTVASGFGVEMAQIKFKKKDATPKD